MINLTVKTLDSRNHQFSVEDDITVEQFKRQIADTVNIPAETQRIIYCGRVLQDSSKLNDYDVDGKVVHLVQRPPPSANPSSSRSSRSSSPHPQRRVFRGLDHGNTMFLGSVAFPTNLMDSQGIVPPPPTHSHAGSRLNVARRMLRRAEQVISQLENPNGTTETVVEDPQDEVTPVIEARVIVPSNGAELLDEAALLSAVHNYSLLSGQNRRGQTSGNVESPNTADELLTNATAGNTTSEHSATPQGTSGTNSNSTFPENATRTSSMADLLTTLSQLQLRFAPFLERYHNFMREDPEVSQEDARAMQHELNRVSEVLHFLGHAYHSLSDIIVRVRPSPPRPLLCRPILIQHSAVLQTGIPIQVEAQINVSSDRPSNVQSASNTQTPGTGEMAPPSTTAPTATPQPFPSQAVPLISTVRVPIPLEIRGFGPPQGLNNPFISNPASLIHRDVINAAMATGLNTANVPASATSTAPTSTGSSGTAAPPTSASFGASNPEVEFIMEVTPEGITIDSLETGLIGPNQADDLLRGALNGQQPPNLIQSIMQMAGRLMTSRGGVPFPTEPTAPPQQSSATSAPPLTPTPPAQNSQARGNNQTHPTSSTHTRSTARPHVHLQQQTMQGGFDPFLPCNSHHVSRRRGPHVSTQQQATTSGTSRTEQQQATAAAQDATNQLNSLVNNIVNSIRHTYQMRRPSGTSQTDTSAPSGAASQGAGEGGSRPAAGADRVPSAPPEDHAYNSGPTNITDILTNGPTLAQILQQLPPDNSYVAGESVIMDFIMMMSRNITIGDLISLNGGSVAPLARMAREIQDFFLASVTNGSTSTEAIEEGIDRLLLEMQPFLDTLSQIRIRDDIDIEASVRRLLRAKLPLIFQLSSTLADEPDNLRLLVDNVVAACKEFCALALHACTDGIQGVDQIFEIVATRYMQGIPADLQEWTLITSRSHLRELVSNLNVPLDTIEAHIVRRNESEIVEPMFQQESSIVTSEQPMETEEASMSSIEVTPAPCQKIEDLPEPLPNVVIGSESWHNQVPEDWVPIIARDAQRQKKQHSQPPFSDAYLSGMPSKRRKIVHAAKGRQNLSLPQIIAESVRRAVTTTGLSSVAPLDVVAQAAGASTDIQTAYRGLLRSSVQPGLRDNDDFTPERFPHAATYFGEL